MRRLIVVLCLLGLVGCVDQDGILLNPPSDRYGCVMEKRFYPACTTGIFTSTRESCALILCGMKRPYKWRLYVPQDVWNVVKVGDVFDTRTMTVREWR